MSNTATEMQDTLLACLLRNAPRDGFPTNASPQTLHPFASTLSDDPQAQLRNLVDASAVLSRTLQSYSSFSAPDHKFVSTLRQSTALIDSLSTVSERKPHSVQRNNYFPIQSTRGTQRRVKALKERSRAGVCTMYDEPIPLADELIVEWCISRIEDWGRKAGMEVFKEEEEGQDRRMTIMLGGKVLVIDVDLAIQRNASKNIADRITVAGIKTSHALPSGSTGNALAERSTSLDAFILRTWNDYLEEVQRNEVDSSVRAAHLSRDIQRHLAYLMKLDDLVSQEGDRGIRWFNDTGLMSAVADRISKAEADSLSTTLQSMKVNLDVFLNRAHALAIPYLVSPSMSFLTYLSPLAYYSLLRASGKSGATSAERRHDNAVAFSKLDIPLSVLRDQLTQRHSRPCGAVIAMLTLTSLARLSSSDRRREQRPTYGRPHFNLPSASVLGTLDHFLLVPSPVSTKVSEEMHSMQDAWVLDFTGGDKTGGVVMSHSRMREIQNVIDPMSTRNGLGFGMQMQMPPLSESWIGLLLNPGRPPSERYIAVYKSPSDAHPPLRLRLSAPNEGGFLLQQVPVTSLKEVYGVLEIVRDQCWINETLKTIPWVPEDLMPDDGEDVNEIASLGAPGADLEALLNGTFSPKRIPVNVFLPAQPPSFPSGNNEDTSDGLSLDPVPGLSSMSVGGNTTQACIALAFAMHKSGPTELMRDASSAFGPRQVALVLRHDRNRKRGVRVDVNVSSAADLGYGGLPGERPSAAFVDELDESLRRGGAFGTAGKVWAWLTEMEH